MSVFVGLHMLKACLSKQERDSESMVHACEAPPPSATTFVCVDVYTAH